MSWDVTFLKSCPLIRINVTVALTVFKFNCCPSRLLHFSLWLFSSGIFGFPLHPASLYVATSKAGMWKCGFITLFFFFAHKLPTVTRRCHLIEAFDPRIQKHNMQRESLACSPGRYPAQRCSNATGAANKLWWRPKSTSRVTRHSSARNTIHKQLGRRLQFLPRVPSLVTLQQHVLLFKNTFVTWPLRLTSCFVTSQIHAVTMILIIASIY